MDTQIQDDLGCYTNDCYFGRHNECPDVDGNCCDCSCHCGHVPSKSPYQRAQEAASQ